MSQLVLDDQLDIVKILPGLRRWATYIRLQELRPGEHILDERIPEILRTCHEPEPGLNISGHDGTMTSCHDFHDYAKDDAHAHAAH